MNYSIEKLAAANGEAFYELRIWQKGRRGRQNKRRFSTRKEAQNELDRILRDLKDDRPAFVGEALFGQEYAYWRRENDAEFAPGWRVNLDGYWRESKDLLEFCRISDLGKAVSELKLRWQNLSPKTINNKMGFIHAVLNFSVEKERITHNPLGAYQKLSDGLADIEFWEQVDAESFLEFLNERYPEGSKNRWIYIACLTTLNTGVRAGELWALRPSDIKPSHSSIRVSRQFNRVSRAFSAPKGKEPRSVPMSKSLYEELLKLAKTRKTTELLFSKDQKPIDHDAFHDIFDKDIKDWGGKRITFHGLRHTAATQMLLAGVDIKSLQEIMGHKDIKTTMRYLHAVGNSAKRASELYSLKPRTNVLRLADFG